LNRPAKRQEKTMIEPRAVPLRNGWQWLVDGFQMFRRNIMAWVVLVMVLVLIGLALGLIPVLGQLLFYLFSPVFLAGVMEGCRALEKGEELELAHLFAGFRKNTTPLVTLGGIYLVGQILTLGLMLLVGGDAIYRMFFEAADEREIAEALQAMDQMTLPILLGLALSLPLMMGLWFSPLLVMFQDARPVPAMLLSLQACLKNIPAFLLYGVAIFVAALAAIIPFGLGLLILVPTIFGSIYAGYMDVFTVRKESQGGAGAA
jgi:uncharacterized membrane protein